MSVEGPLTEAEREKLHSILADPKALDAVIDKALKGWNVHGSWKKRIKNP
jgi:hypothetical protein